jgi:DNA-binding NarL/FixJ family response regulator
LKILFVENHQLFAKTVIEQFLAAHEVVVVSTVRAANAIDSSTFDAVLVDYDLPDGKGTEVVVALRARYFAGKIIAVSSKDDGNAELRRAGADVVCSKRDFAQITRVLDGPSC